jgi:four helix bundle protein
MQGNRNNWLRYCSMMAYEKFEAWKAAHQLALLVYDITDRWPVQERYQLTSQVRRAALSVPTNIAEGAAKRGTKEFRRYLDIARGSLSELTYLLHFSKDRGLINETTMSGLDVLRNQAGRLTWGLYASLGRPKRI